MARKRRLHQNRHTALMAPVHPNLDLAQLLDQSLLGLVLIPHQNHHIRNHHMNRAHHMDRNHMDQIHMDRIHMGQNARTDQVLLIQDSVLDSSQISEKQFLA